MIHQCPFPIAGKNPFFLHNQFLPDLMAVEHLALTSARLEQPLSVGEIRARANGALLKPDDEDKWL